MKKEVISIYVDSDLKKVFEEQRGLVKESTYGNYILREYFTQQGLLPEKVSA